MALFLWPQELDPDFPLAVIDFRTRGDGDRMHWHEYLEIALCLEGSGQFLFGRRAQRVEPGDIFLVDDSQPHVAQPDAGGSLRLLLVLFRPELVAAPGCRPFDSGYLTPFRSPDAHALERIPRATRLAAELTPILHALAAISAREDPDDRHLLDANLRLALGILVRECQAGSADTGPTDAAQRKQIRPVLSYVEAHCRERVTLDEVAEVVHLSPSRVRHVFRDVSGVGFKEYATRVRLAEAKRLLLATDCSVAEVAHSVGYTNVHQFYNVFHRYFSLSPAAYRRYYTPAVEGERSRGSDADGASPHTRTTVSEASQAVARSDAKMLVPQQVVRGGAAPRRGTPSAPRLRPDGDPGRGGPRRGSPRPGRGTT